jgi:hypothetical protein
MRIFNCNVPTEEGFYPAIEIVGFTITWVLEEKVLRFLSLLSNVRGTAPKELCTRAIVGEEN